jgi:hypothetical protein
MCQEKKKAPRVGLEQSLKSSGKAGIETERTAKCNASDNVLARFPLDLRVLIMAWEKLSTTARKNILAIVREEGSEK